MGHSPHQRDQLTPSSSHLVLVHHAVQYLELHIPNGLFAQGTFSGGPLEALHDAVFAHHESGLVSFGGQGVIHQQVGALGGGTEGPDGPTGQDVPVEFFPEHFGQTGLVIYRETGLFYFLLEGGLQGTSQERETVLLVGTLAGTLDAAGLDDSLAERDRWVADLDLYLGVYLSQVV